MKDLPNQGYIYPMVCGSCLKAWFDNKHAQLEEEVVELIYDDFAVRKCPRCIRDEEVEALRGRT